MSQAREEDRLREGFQRLRSETEAPGRVPDFGAMVAAARADAADQPDLRVVAGGRTTRTARRQRSLLVGGAASAAMAAAVAGVMLFGGRPDADEEFDRLVSAYASDRSVGAWRSPTSALLDVPGMDLTRSVPSLGGAIRGLDPSSRPSASEPEGRDS